MPRVPLAREATYEDLVRLPDHVVGEILDGELYSSPRPAPKHAWSYARLLGLLNPAFDQGRGGPGGWLILAEPELHFGRSVLVPDLAGWRRERMPRLPDEPYFTTAPDWVCEILSPSTMSLDRGQKLATYGRERVQHAWLVDPGAQTLEVLARNDDGHWRIVDSYDGRNVVRAVPFDAIEMDLALIWPPQPATIENE